MKIFTVALQKDGKLLAGSYELIEAAKSLGGEIYTAILAEDASSLASELASRGGGNVLVVSHPQLKHYNDDVYVKVLSSLIAKYSPNVVLGPASFYGKALFGRLAAAMDAPMASDVTAISQNGDSLTATRPSYGGSVIAQVANADSSKPFFVTIRMKIYPESKDGAGEVVQESVDEALLTSNMTIKEVKAESAGSVNLTEADVIVSAGRGIKGTENIPMVKDLANVLKGAFGASRAIVDAGWTEYSNQVGQTGKTVNPKLYIAIGISGAIQHLVGMQTSKTIVAVNKDKDAPIFNIATYGIVGDAFEIVPALTEKFKAELS
ncbi:MAG: electron transfer flavoprotein subunit alpha/FixB family protein [Candidatus Zixiibacteriota bacterium]|nr:MAG: electron transfer flavoprotein subunit alpha/FixB family protein [candidate division Zixibacteria bacterium]